MLTIATLEERRSEVELKTSASLRCQAAEAHPFIQNNIDPNSRVPIISIKDVYIESMLVDVYMLGIKHQVPGWFPIYSVTDVETALEPRSEEVRERYHEQRFEIKSLRGSSFFCLGELFAKSDEQSMYHGSFGHCSNPDIAELFANRLYRKQSLYKLQPPHGFSHVDAQFDYWPDELYAEDVEKVESPWYTSNRYNRWGGRYHSVNNAGYFLRCRYSKNKRSYNRRVSPAMLAANYLSVLKGVKDDSIIDL